MISDSRIKELVRNAMYGGLNCEDVSLSECIEFAVRKAAEESAPTFHEVGVLYRYRDGEVRFHQHSEMVPFPIYSSIPVYVKGVPGSKPQLHDDGN